MSGNSGDGGGPSIYGTTDAVICANLVINTNLASPQADVINNLKIGDILSIRTKSDQGPIEAVDRKNAVAGSIISREQVRLLMCINSGTSYEAKVLKIENGQCSVQIHAV